MLYIHKHKIRRKKNLHLLSLGSSISSTGMGFDKSSKFIINNDISSTSERIGAITSEHKNFAPISEWNKVSIFNNCIADEK
jgi:hypothetical protein